MDLGANEKLLPRSLSSGTWLVRDVLTIFKGSWQAKPIDPA